MPHRCALPGCKLRVREHVIDTGEVAYVGVPSNEINAVLQHAGVEPTQEGSRCITFLGDFVLDVNSAKCDCGSPQQRRVMASHAQQKQQGPCVFLFSQDDEVVAVRSGVGQKRHEGVIAGCQKAAERICVGFLRAPSGFHWSTEAALILRKFTDRVGEDVKGRLGFTKTCHRKHTGRRFGKGFVLCALWMQVCFPASTVLAI